MRLLPLVLGTALALHAPHAFAQANNACQPADPLIKWCPAQPADSILPVIHFNPSLDPLLETSFGNAATRDAAFSQAVQDWNNALAAVGAKVRIRMNVDLAKWAADQGGPVCVDNHDPLASVFAEIPGTHRPTPVENATSTGHNHGNAHLDGNAMPVGPGWIVPFGQMISDTSGAFDIDAVLGVTEVTIDGQNCIQEGDIWWLTHFKMFGVNPCIRLSWDYRYPMGPDPARTDFYTVMLHELGHFLGLRHQDADPAGTNVMQASIPKGTRRSIGQKERACLCALYGGVNCMVTPVDRSSWGRIKTHYR